MPPHARASQLTIPLENTDFCISCPATWRRSNNPKKAFPNAKHGHGSQFIRSSSEAARSVRTDSRWYEPSGSFCRESLADEPDGCRKVAGSCSAVRRIMRSSAGAGGSEGTESLYGRIKVTSDPQLLAARRWAQARCARRLSIGGRSIEEERSFVWRLTRESL